MTHGSFSSSVRRLLRKAHRLNLEAAEKISTSEQAKSIWTRREFLRNATLAGGTALATQLLPSSQIAWSFTKGTSKPQVAIIGAGLAGLNSAYQLKKAGITATVYEASSQVGGRVRSVSNALGSNIVVDLGGSFINSNHEDMLTLARELGIELVNQKENAQKLNLPLVSYYFNQKRISEAELAEKLRPLAAQIAKDAELIDKDFNTYAPPIDRLSVAQYLDKYAALIPDVLMRQLIERGIRSEYGVELAESSAIQLIFMLPTVKEQQVEVVGSSDETFVAAQGNGQFAEKLANVLKGQVKTGKELVGLTAQGATMQLQFKSGETISADMVIMAIPLPVLRRIKLNVQLPQGLSRVIKELDLGRNEKIQAGFNQRVWQQKQGFAQELWTDIGFCEAWDDTQRSPALKEGVLTYFFGGNETQAALSGNVSAQGKLYTNKLTAAVQGLETVATGKFLRTAWEKDPFIQGSYTNFKPGQYTEFKEFRYVESQKPDERRDVHVNNLIFAGEQFSDEYYGFMNGAAQTGRLAAAVVIKLLK